MTALVVWVRKLTGKNVWLVIHFFDYLSTCVLVAGLTMSGLLSTLDMVATKPGGICHIFMVGAFIYILPRNKTAKYIDIVWRQFLGMMIIVIDYSL